MKEYFNSLTCPYLQCQFYWRIMRICKTLNSYRKYCLPNGNVHVLTFGEPPPQAQ